MQSRFKIKERNIVISRIIILPLLFPLHSIHLHLVYLLPFLPALVPGSVLLLLSSHQHCDDDLKLPEPEKDRDNITIRLKGKELMEIPIIHISKILFQCDTEN